MNNTNQGVVFSEERNNKYKAWDQLRYDIRDVTRDMINFPLEITNLDLLHQQIRALFRHGPELALSMYKKLRICLSDLDNKEFLINSEDFLNEMNKGQSQMVRWRHHTHATAVPLMFAAISKKQRTDARNYVSACAKRMTNGVGQVVAKKELMHLYRAARSSAQKKRQTTILAVSIYDVHYTKLAAEGLAEKITSFGHSFAMGLGCQGVRVWQAAGGERGYGLDEWIEKAESEMLRWEEADAFIKDVIKLTQTKGPFDQAWNTLYRQCFHHDLLARSELGKPVTPIIDAQVHVLDMEVERKGLIKFNLNSHAESPEPCAR